MTCNFAVPSWSTLTQSFMSSCSSLLRLHSSHALEFSGIPTAFLSPQMNGLMRICRPNTCEAQNKCEIPFKSPFSPYILPLSACLFTRTRKTSVRRYSVVIIVSKKVPTCSVLGSNFHAIIVPSISFPLLISLASISYSPDVLTESILKSNPVAAKTYSRINTETVGLNLVGRLDFR